MKTYSCRPGLKDTQVLEFCKQGFLVLEGVVPDEINRRTVEFLDRYPSHEPTEILLEDWFVDNVILNPQAAGAVRSLLGQNFGLPIIMSNHRVNCPSPAQNWHRDGNSKYGPALNYLQVFYYPEDCSLDLGPTEVLPGSHFLFSLSKNMGHYGGIRGAHRAAAPAGSIFFTVYSIWHRRSAASGKGYATCSSTTIGAPSLRIETGSGSLTSTLRRPTTSWRIRLFASSSATAMMLPKCISGCSASRNRLLWQAARVGR